MSASAVQIPPDVRAAHRQLSPAAERFLEYLLEHPDEARQLEGLEETFPGWMFGSESTPLNWPTFIDARKRRELQRATEGVCMLVKAIPSVVFGGDLDAIADFYGYDDPGALEIFFEVPSPMDSTVARCDVIDTADGLKFCEVNMAANIGGWQHRFWRDTYLDHPVITRFCAREGVVPRFQDPLRAGCGQIVEDAIATGVADGGELNILLTYPVPPAEWVHRLAGETYAELLRETGRGLAGELWITSAPAEELSFRGNRVYRGDRRVHVFFEYTPGTVPTGVVRAQVAGAVRVYNGGLTRIWVDKRNLALLSENEGLEGWEDEDRAIIRDHVPWTRLVAARTTTRRGEEVRFPGFVVEHRDELVLKRGAGSGGEYVVVGRFTAPAEWEARVRDAVQEGGWIVQERVESRPYAYPPRRGAAPVPHTLIWGLFCAGWRYAGSWLRMLPQGMGDGIVSIGRGAAEGAILEV